MSAEENFRYLGVRTAMKKGGSLLVTIPVEAIRIMRLASGDQIAFFQDRRSKQIFIGKIEKVTTRQGLSFSVSKELARKLLKEEKESEK